MRHRALPLFAAIAIATAASAASLPWKRVGPPNEAFSIETPCSDAEIENYRNAPEQVSEGISLKRDSRVLCLQDNMLLAAAVVEIGDAGTGQSAFDMLVSSINEDVPAGKQKPAVVIVNGRRAVLNRESGEGIIAQTGFVDMGGSKIVLLISGFQPGSKASLTEQAATIDRFTNSLKVAGK